MLLSGAIFKAHSIARVNFGCVDEGIDCGVETFEDKLEALNLPREVDKVLVIVLKNI